MNGCGESPERIGSIHKTPSNFKPQWNATVKTNNFIWISVAALAISTASAAHGQAPAVPPTPTIWRFIGIPQGIQKIRDVTVNRRGNFPGLERKPPLKRIADPANLESTNPAIKAAAEIKQAEDLKAQKIKAIKFLAKMGCGCYDKEGKITDALIAAMDDCTPDVRLAAIEAIETAASGECCSKCGSTTCCSEKVTKRLSEIAYERDDSGCPLEPSAEIRAAAAKALCTCCPNRATGPIEEDVPDEPLPIPTPVVPDPVSGEGQGGGEPIEGEGGAVESTDEVDVEGATETSASDASTAAESLKLFQSAKAEPKATTPDVEIGSVKMIGGMAIQPVTISPVGATEEVSEAVSLSLSDDSSNETAAQEAEATETPEVEKSSLPTPIALPIIEETQQQQTRTVAPKPIARKKVVATVVGVDQKSGRVILRSGQELRPGASVTVYHQFLTGERLVAHMLIDNVNGSQATAMVTDPVSLMKIHTGDRAICF